jgi:hypothetical protein
MTTNCISLAKQFPIQIPSADNMPSRKVYSQEQQRLKVMPKIGQKEHADAVLRFQIARIPIRMSS